LDQAAIHTPVAMKQFFSYGFSEQGRPPLTRKEKKKENRIIISIISHRISSIRKYLQAKQNFKT
jgi:hypothetical protein